MKLKKTDIQRLPPSYIKRFVEESGIVIYQTRITFCPFEILFEFDEEADLVYWTDFPDGYFIADPSITVVRQEIRKEMTERHEKLHRMFNNP